MSGLDHLDLRRYPIHDETSDAYRQLVQACRRSFLHDAVVTLPGFLHATGLAAVTADIAPRIDRAFFCRTQHNVYLEWAAPENVADDLNNSFATTAQPRDRLSRTNVGSIANDDLAPDGPLQQVYDLSELSTFIAQVVGADHLYRSEDPLGALSVNVFEPGDAHAWHFDEALFTVTLMVRPATTGGHFEYHQGLRKDGGDGDLDALNACLDETGPAPERLRFDAGTLSIFAGRHTLHRVTTIEGDQARLVPVLTYATTPGYRNSDEVRTMFWGRAGAR